MKKYLILSTSTFIFFIALTAFKPPKTSYPKNDILYSKYGGDVDLMMREERKKDSLARPYLYEVKKEDTTTVVDDLGDESVIVEKADVMPVFPDGEKGLQEYIASNIVFLVDTLVGKKANVTVKFFVNKLGNAKNPIVVKSDNPSFNLQSIIIVENMPSWTPAKKNGKEVNCYVTLPIKYGQ
jgi:hypothetical protein